MNLTLNINIIILKHELWSSWLYVHNLKLRFNNVKITYLVTCMKLKRNELLALYFIAFGFLNTTHLSVPLAFHQPRLERITNTQFFLFVVVVEYKDCVFYVQPWRFG